MIYVAEILDGKFVKIGFCADESPQKRLAQLQTGNPYQINLVFAVVGTLRQEQALHSALRVAFDRIFIKTPGNEWYPGRHPFMRNIIAQLGTGGANAAIAFAERYNPAVKQWGKRRPKGEVQGGDQPRVSSDSNNSRQPEPSFPA